MALSHNKAPFVSSVAAAQTLDVEALPAPLAKAVNDAIRLRKTRLVIAANRIHFLYAPLMWKWGLAPDQEARLRDLIAERCVCVQEANQLSLAAGLPPESAPDLDTIMGAATADADDAIRLALGPEKYAQFETYQSSSFNREWVVGPLQWALLGNENALTEEQIAALSASLPANYAGTDTLMRAGMAADLPESFEKTAKEVLNPEQLATFQQYRQVWQARQTMIRIGEEAVLSAPSPRSP